MQLTERVLEFYRRIGRPCAVVLWPPRREDERV